MLSPLNDQWAMRNINHRNCNKNTNYSHLSVTWQRMECMNWKCFLWPINQTNCMIEIDTFSRNCRFKMGSASLTEENQNVCTTGRSYFVVTLKCIHTKLKSKYLVSSQIVSVNLLKCQICEIVQSFPAKMFKTANCPDSFGKQINWVRAYLYTMYLHILQSIRIFSRWHLFSLLFSLLLFWTMPFGLMRFTAGILLKFKVHE